MTRTKTDKSKKSTPLVTPFSKTFKRCKKHTWVIAWVRHLCNGGLHAVGLTNKGQLVFSHHTPKELRRALVLEEFGLGNHKCACLYKAWATSQRDSQVINLELSRERLVWNTYGLENVKDPKTGETTQKPVIGRPDMLTVLAYKVMQKRRSRREPTSYGSAAAVSKLIRGSNLQHGTYVPTEYAGFDGTSRDDAARAVMSVLQSWGWKDVDTTSGNKGHIYCKMKRRPGEPPHDYTHPENFEVAYFFERSAGASRYIQFETSHLSNSGGLTITLNNATGGWNLRHACDATEFTLIKEMLRRQVLGRQTMDKADLAERANTTTARIRKQWPNVYVSVQDEAKATFQVTLKIDQLTAQGAAVIVRELEELAGKKVRLVTAASYKRRGAKLRTPVKPGNAVGLRSGLKDPREKLT